MNPRKIFAGIAAAGVVICIAVASDLRAVAAQPTIAGAFVLAVIAAYVLGKDQGTPNDSPPTP